MANDIRSIARVLAALGKMSMRALRARYSEVFGEETTSHNAAFLRKKVAWGIQWQAEGGLSERALARIAELQQRAPLRERPPLVDVPTTAAAVARTARDPSLPAVGTVLRRVHKGRTHEVKVLEDGFMHLGKTYETLSAVAKAITGTTWNGRLFFGLTTRKRKEAA
jgi:hypothetical protein